MQSPLTGQVAEAAVARAATSRAPAPEPAAPALSAVGPASAQGLLMLQRAAGNAAVLSMRAGLVQRHATTAEVTTDEVVHAGTKPTSPHFDVEDTAFRSWIAAYLSARESKNNAPIEGGALETFVREAMQLWCEKRKDKDQHFHRSQVQAVAAWIAGSVKAWGATFWAQIPDKGLQIDAALDLVAHDGRIAEPDARMLDQLHSFDFSPADRGRVMVRPATFKTLHMQTGKAGQSLESAEQNWAPTGTFTGGGAKGFGGAQMPWNIMVSRSLATPRDVLQALLFEVENVKRWHRLEGLRLAEGAGKTGAASERAAVEYETFAANQLSVRAAFRADSQEALCLSLGVPRELLVRVEEGRPVPKPPVTQVRDATARNALWWYQTETWSEQVRRKAWIAAEHGGGMASSTDLYKGSK